MPSCSICRKRIELAFRGVRAYRCSKCGSTVCADHFVRERKLCHRCAGFPFIEARRTFVQDRGKEGTA